MLLSISTFSAQAQLTATANGLGVYDSGINATWTQGANLLGTLESTQGFNPIVDAIIAAVPVIYDTRNSLDGSYNKYGSYSGSYSLSVNDFGSDGTVDWFAAQAFVHYLDTINYACSSHWTLPTQPDQSFGYNITNSQLGELYYNELHALASPGTYVYANDFGILHSGNSGSYGVSGNAGPFSNAQTYPYWTGTEYEGSPQNARGFNTWDGYQYYLIKSAQYFAWPVSLGQLPPPVPEPSLLVLFSTGLIGFLGLKRRAKA